MITFVNVFTVLPEKQQDALEAIQQVYVELVRHQPGFITAKLLKSDDGNRVTAIANWESEADFDAMRRTPKFQEFHEQSFFEAIISSDGHVYSTVIPIEHAR